MSAPRFAPEVDLPSYAHVPGLTPHPKTSPQGHMHGVPEPEPPPMDPDDPGGSEAYLYGVDLFNLGYYWESHVWWEGLWHAHGRQGPVADLLKGLIRYAAAGVKAKAGRAEGVRDHAFAAAGLFDAVAEAGPRMAGLDLATVAAHARLVVREAATLAESSRPEGPALPEPLLPRI